MRIYMFVCISVGSVVCIYKCLYVCGVFLYVCSVLMYVVCKMYCMYVCMFVCMQVSTYFNLLVKQNLELCIICFNYLVLAE